MTVSHLGKWGRSFAFRVPRAMVERCGLKEGDPIDMDMVEKAILAAKEEAVQDEISRRAFPLPPDWKFDREEANWRPAMDKW
jgi:antitoxin MazE